VNDLTALTSHLLVLINLHCLHIKANLSRIEVIVLITQPHFLTIFAFRNQSKSWS